MRVPIPLRRGPDAISPTAHYTGRVWTRNGLSHPELATLADRHPAAGDAGGDPGAARIHIVEASTAGSGNIKP